MKKPPLVNKPRSTFSSISKKKILHRFFEKILLNQLSVEQTVPLASINLTPLEKN
jgi:hypothetical protein